MLPVDIHHPTATYGTQFGLVERPTHRNTLQDQAKFEVCGQVLGDLSETGYGVTLVSRTKYGYAVEGNVMRCVTSLPLVLLTAGSRSFVRQRPLTQRQTRAITSSTLPSCHMWAGSSRGMYIGRLCSLRIPYTVSHPLDPAGTGSRVAATRRLPRRPSPGREHS